MDPATQAKYLEVISQAGETIQGFASLVDTLSQKIRSMQNDRSDLNSAVDTLAEIIDSHPITTTDSNSIIGVPQPNNPTPGTDAGLKSVADMAIDNPEMLDSALNTTVGLDVVTENEMIGGVFDQIAEQAAELPTD